MSQSGLCCGRGKEFGLGAAITIVIFAIVAVITLFQFALPDAGRRLAKMFNPVMTRSYRLVRWLFALV
ncbi:MAG: hypothetical protein R2932_41520 [Caldilineaceae bacterium]